MNLTCFMLVMTLFVSWVFASDSNGQGIKSTIITIQKKVNDLGQVLEEIENQTDYTFFYEDNQVRNDYYRVKCKIADGSVFDILSEVSNQTGLAFRQVNNTIAIRKETRFENPGGVVEIQPQVKAVSGKVTDESGEPLPGVTVAVKGTTRGTVTDIEGNFNLPGVAPTDILQFSFVGMLTQEVAAGPQSEINVTMRADAVGIDEVVVTALGIKREKKALGYAVQEVKGETLQTAKEPNVLNSLTGKVSGLTIKNQPGLFENPVITLRGNSNILVVIDGIPRETNFWDVNSDDIEEMTVLKGPAAAALYGSRGQNGAIMISTKRGGGKSKVEVSVNSSFMFQPNFVYQPERQFKYGQGDWGEFAYVDGAGGGTYDSDVYAWGPRLDQKDQNTQSGWVELPQWNSPIDPSTGKRVPIPFISRGKNNIENFFRTGNVISNNISIGATNERGDFRLSLTQLGQKGIDPNARLDATTVSLSGRQRLSKLITMEAAMTYNKQYTDNYPRTSYYSDNNMYNIMVWMSADVDVRDLKQYWIPGKEGVEQRNYNYAYYNNPYYIANEFLQEYKKDVVYGYAKLLFDITPDLKLSVRSSVNWFNRYVAEKRPKGFVGYRAGYVNGGFYPSNYYEFDINSEFLFTYDKTFFE
ncbi:MAG: carboxypeptidase-like regulatory domain-containing protein, partial [Draconibacterium sp.]